MTQDSGDASNALKSYWTMRRFTDPVPFKVVSQSTGDSKGGEGLNESLAKSLGRAQIDAAGRIRQYMKEWLLADDTLELLKERFPENVHCDQVLAKVTAVNTLYATNLYAVIPMANRIVEVMAAHSVDSVTLVNNIAAMNIGGKKRTFRSFASKFVHWFVDPCCPILDSFAVNLIYQHLGTKAPNTALDDGWQAYCHEIERLKRLAGLNCTERELDRYLWLAGQCLRIRSNECRVQQGEKRLPVNGELQRTWNERESKGLTREFEILLAGFHDPQRVR